MKFTRKKVWTPVDPHPEMPVAPHCDSLILHAPGECKFCDVYPSWQQGRMQGRVNFTNHHDSDLAECPSTWRRDDETRDRWPGNRAVLP